MYSCLYMLIFHSQLRVCFDKYNIPEPCWSCSDDSLCEEEVKVDNATSTATVGCETGCWVSLGRPFSINFWCIFDMDNTMARASDSCREVRIPILASSYAVPFMFGVLLI